LWIVFQYPAIQDGVLKSPLDNLMARSLSFTLLAAFLATVGFIALISQFDNGFGFGRLLLVTGLPAFIIGACIITVWQLVKAQLSKKASPHGFDVIFKESATVDSEVGR
jgi:hypothetical protein